MAGFAKDRKWTITEKNKSAMKSMEIGDKTEGFVKKRQEMEEGISRIPDDLPQELQQEVDRAIENARKEMEAEGSELANEAKEAQEEADHRAKEAFLAGVEIHEEAARRNDGYTADYIFMDEYTCANDDFLRGVKWNSISSISFELAEPEEPEQELEAGDSSMLDAFLGEFLAPGA